MSREEIFFDAITNLREELVEEAQEYVFHKHSWRRYTRLAACLALTAILCLGIYRSARNTADAGNSSNTAMPPSGEYDVCPEDSIPEAVRFTASVLEVRADSLLVSTAEYGPVEVPTGGLENLPVVHENDRVTVRCERISLEDGLCRAVGVTAIVPADV